ncbi:MAG: rhomboid family intramembrane serine protease [Oligoflexia bacterium]|nr:rhomboid family intramembrane serine protease [Oligoflexia bacterium]
MNNRRPFDFNQIMPLSPICRKLILTMVVFWFFAIVIVEQFFLSEPYITEWLALRPLTLVKSFAVWQPLTYMFVHTVNPFHIIFNLLLLWWLGSELERLWGQRFFLLYFFATGILTALLYSLTVLLIVLAGGSSGILGVPVIGPSAAIFGLMTAYGIVFGDRTVYFLFVFAMKARYFVLVLGALELVLVLNNGFGGSQIASLAHLGGIVVGLVLLKLSPYLKFSGKAGKSKTSKLKLVVNNPSEDESDKPKYWN